MSNNVLAAYLYGILVSMNDSGYIKYLKHEKEKAIILVIIGAVAILVNLPIVVAMFYVFW